VLGAGERVVLHRHPHWWVLVGPVLAFLLVLGVAGYLAAVARLEGAQAWAWPAIGVTAGALVVVLTVLPVLRWRTTHLVLTTRRLLVGEGVRRAQSVEVALDRIASVHARRTRIGRLTGCGSLVITGADGEVEFVDVPGVDGVRARLLSARPRPAARPPGC
jgi:membrane protein YdbS with pleckstrin-like domain